MSRPALLAVLRMLWLWCVALICFLGLSKAFLGFIGLSAGFLFAIQLLSVCCFGVGL